MPVHQHHIKSVVAAFVIAGVCLLSFPAAAQQQQSGPQNKQATLADDDFINLQQQIKELKNATFRAFLRMQLLSWESPEASPTRRQAAIAVATQGVTDLCDHQDEVWRPTASWLHGIFVKQIKNLRSPEEIALEICALKAETANKSAKDFSSGIKMLSDPETSAAGLDLAKSAILSGQVPVGAMLGQLLTLEAAHSLHLYELLSAVVSLEEKQPGALTLTMMPFYSSLFLGKSVPPDLTTRWLFVAVKASRLSAEELASPIVGGPVNELLNGIAGPAQRLAPALYPEIAGRLKSLNKNSPNILETRLAAEERIAKASDQLEQLISEANSASEKGLKTHFFFRAARLAKDQGQLSKAVDLAMKVANISGRDGVDGFLSEIVSVAVNRKSPRDATYAISQMIRPMDKARAFRLLGEYYGENDEKVKSKEAFSQSARQLESVDNSNDKVRASLSLAESILKYEPADAYEVFREAVKAINNLPSPGPEQEKMYYVKLMPVAEELIRSFRILAVRENETATRLAAEIKLSELRVSALSGAYSR